MFLVDNLASGERNKMVVPTKFLDNYFKKQLPLEEHRLPLKKRDKLVTPTKLPKEQLSLEEVD
jgi:hypothetical protein